jgi:hypothetical protein
MNFHWCWFLFCTALLVFPAGAETLTLHVAPDGDDAHTGAKAATDGGADGPLASLAGARDRIRALKAAGEIDGPVQVLLRGGEYPLTEAVVFTPEDSGTADAPISYMAYPGEDPVLLGGRRITGWKKEGGFMAAEIPEVRDGAWDFSSFFVNGERRHPARTPNASNHPAGDYPEDDDFFYADGPVMEKDKDGKEKHSSTRFRYRDDDVKDWASLEDAIFVIYHSWATSMHRVKSLDTENRIVEFTGPARWHFCRWRNDQWYFIEHLFEALDQPGEWFLDRDEGKLYYIPKPGEDMATAEAIAPVTKQFIVLEGNPAEEQFISHLHFKGLKMRYTDWSIGPEGHSDGQAEYTLPAVWQAAGARHCVLEDCEIAHAGAYGVWFRAGCQQNVMQRCEVTDLGAGGVRIGEGASPKTPAEAAAHNRIDNNFLHDGGRLYRSAVGVWIGRSSHNTIKHNEVCDFRYSGMSIGWSWGYAESSAHHNSIAYNHIHHVGRGQLSDMGGIYTLGVSPGTVLRNNFIHDVQSNPKISGGWGLYTDEGSSEIVMENNIVCKTVTGTFHQHYGRENILRNNILCFSEREQLIRSREEDHISFLIDGNIIYYNNGRLLGSRWENGNFRLDNNIYWDTSGMPVEFKGLTLEEWQAEGFDKHSVIADPLFEDIMNFDFRLKPASPALAKGFRQIDMDAIGLYGDPEWVNRPKAIERPPFTPPEMPEPASIHEDFEKLKPGDSAEGATVLGASGDAWIRVTDAVAASGSKSLQFNDQPGLDKAFMPYLVWSPGLRRGTAIGSFRIRLEENAAFYHEWRDNYHPYRSGPGVWFENGVVKAGGRELMPAPAETWIGIEIICPLGRDADGTWKLAVTLPGETPQVFENLPCGNAKFRTLDWFGFVANDNRAVRVWIDDVHLDLK